MKSTLPLALFVLTACSSAEMSGVDTGPPGGDEPTDTGTGGDSVPDDTDNTPGAPWFAIAGTLLLSDGTPNVSASALTFEFRSDPAIAASDPDTDDTDSTEQLLPCIASPTLVSLSPAPIPEGEPVLGLWTLTLQMREGETCNIPVPTPLRIGIGALDPALHPAMDAQGFDTTDSSLYGLVAQVQSNPVWTFGIAGTADNINGTTAPVTEAPLPDGSYLLRTLHLLPTEPID